MLQNDFFLITITTTCHLKSLHIVKRPYSNTGNTTAIDDPYEQALGNSGEEKRPFNRKEHLGDVSSGKGSHRPKDANRTKIVSRCLVSGSS